MHLASVASVFLVYNIVQLRCLIIHRFICLLFLHISGNARNVQKEQTYKTMNNQKFSL